MSLGDLWPAAAGMMPQDKEVLTPAEAFSSSSALFHNLTGRTSPDIVLFASNLWCAIPEHCVHHPDPRSANEGRESVAEHLPSSKMAVTQARTQTLTYRIRALAIGTGSGRA